ARAAARLEEVAADASGAERERAEVEPPALADPQLEEPVRRTLADFAEQAAEPAVHSPPRLSASQVVAQARDAQAAAIGLLRPLPRRPSPAAVRGTAFHAWLETRFGSATLLDLEDLAALEDPAEAGDLADARA